MVWQICYEPCNFIGCMHGQCKKNERYVVLTTECMATLVADKLWSPCYESLVWY